MPQDKITNPVKEDIAQTGEISSDHQAKGTLRLRLKGSWKIGARFPSADDVKKQIDRIQYGEFNRLGQRPADIFNKNKQLLFTE
jgi:hypothetical protein